MKLIFERIRVNKILSSMWMLSHFKRILLILIICATPEFLIYSFFCITAPKYTSKGKLRLSAIKANCSNKFIMCDKDTPYPLPSSFKITPATTEIEKVAPFFGSCLVFSYTFEKGVVLNLELLEVSCAVTNLQPFICELASL